MDDVEAQLRALPAPQAQALRLFLAGNRPQIAALVADQLHPRPVFSVLSYGGGLDSFAMLLLAINRRQVPDLVIFADVADKNGLDPGEWPGTYNHIREVVQPLCEALGVEFVWLDSSVIPIRASRNHPAGFRSLFDYYRQTGQMFGRMSRVCTNAAKVDRIWEYVERICPPGRRIEMWIGFEAGEESRAKKDPHAQGGAGADRSVRFPLMEAGMCRCRAETFVRELGQPVPRKSACMFCGFNSRGDFQRLAQELPEVFAKVQQLEDDSKLTRTNQKKLRYGYENGVDDPRLTDWINKPYTRRQMPCKVCGAAVRASKQVGCSDLDSDEAPERPPQGLVPVERLSRRSASVPVEPWSARSAG